MSMPPRADEHFGRDPVSRIVAAGVDRVIRVVPGLERFRRFAEMLTRFAGVGGLSSVLYAIVVAIAVSRFRVHHDLATLVAFAVVTPLNFMMHRGFTFHSLGVVHQDLRRYLLLQVTSFLVSLSIMSLCVDVLRLPYVAGIIGAVVLVPLVSFFVMDRWVFARKAI